MPGQVSFRHVSLSAPREWAHLITNLLTSMCELQMSSQVYWPKHFPTLRAYSEKKIGWTKLNSTSGKLWLMCACTYKVSDSRCALVDAFWEFSYKRRPFRKDYKEQLHHAAQRVGLETALLCIWQGTVIKWCKELVDGVIHRQNSWIRPVCSKFVRHRPPLQSYLS